jgi:quaternary ammonium compound-resistance protein SugE
MAWFVLFIAGLFETAWAVGLKYTHGFTKFWPTVFTLACIVVSMYLLGLATRTLPIGTAYAVWVGIGAAGTVVLGALLLNEPVTAARGFFLGLLAIAILGLKVTAHHPPR